MTQEPIERWLEDHDADDECGVLMLHARYLRPIVAARCAKRPRKVLLLSSRDCDPCVCGDLSGWHPECYWWFVQDHGGDVAKAPAAIEKNALPWRIKTSSEARRK
jgi:hypothetical protein